MRASSMAAVLLLAVQAVHADDRAPDEIAAAALVASADVAYVSDYLSFVGRDERGVVLFTLGTKRGRAGAACQAEHFVALYDARAGWIEVPGYDEFPNTEQRLLEWPASPYFEVEGRPFEGLEVTSATVAVALAVAATAHDTQKSWVIGGFAMQAVEGTLRYGAREVAVFGFGELVR